MFAGGVVVDVHSSRVFCQIWNDGRLFHSVLEESTSASFPCLLHTVQPGDAKSVTLTNFGGKQVIRGGNRIADGLVDAANIAAALEAAHTRRLGNAEKKNSRFTSLTKHFVLLDFCICVVEEGSAICSAISREPYAIMYGPTAGDKIRLGDTEQFAEIERDFAVYGDECASGGGQVLRDELGQACGYSLAYCLDAVITNAVISDYTGIFKADQVITDAVIFDYTGIFKADIGIKGGGIVSLGKAGNPDIMNGVLCDVIIGLSLMFHSSNSGRDINTHKVNTKVLPSFLDQVNIEVIA
ncbi:hypothetical protein RJ639_008968 [Escallonia herrerae]|uniref:Urease alpha-subunit N-terminal domain-containing protein n=1 Tax=Escallonia herrerae TaxID=1293975 RepID=A0AA88VUJ8_9ASTE|nr:hypothetical protein RJ639_008968 [Escallonia herrerae]